MRFIKASTKDRNGTGGKGYLKTNFYQLIEKFGYPHDCTKDGGEWYSADGKVRYEWAFKSVDGKVIVTIYDYKDRCAPEEIKEWRVGGKGSNQKIEKFFSDFYSADHLVLG